MKFIGLICYVPPHHLNFYKATICSANIYMNPVVACTRALYIDIKNRNIVLRVGRAQEQL